MSARNGPVRRSGPWTDKDRAAHDWNPRHGRPLKSLACAQWRIVRNEWARPDHGACGGVTWGPCACNCHYAWAVADLMVRLRDGRVGVCCGALGDPEYTMLVELGGGVEVSVDIGEPVLLDQGWDDPTGPD